MAITKTARRTLNPEHHTDPVIWDLDILATGMRSADRLSDGMVIGAETAEPDTTFTYII